MMNNNPSDIRTCAHQRAWGKWVSALVVSASFLSMMGRVSAQEGDDPQVDKPVKVKKAIADLIVINGRVWTGASTRARARSQEPSAIAVASGRIIAVGSDEQIEGHRGPSTQAINAVGRRVIPGMTDSHIHLIGGGLLLGQLQLRDVKDKAEFVRAVEAASKSVKPGEWLLGGRWSTESWPDAGQPNKSWIDAVTGDVPVFLTRMDGHQGLANSAALRLAKIDAKGPADPVGGDIERDPGTQEPTGILKDAAMDLVESQIPPATEGQLSEALSRAMRHVNSLGITSIHNMSEPRELSVFRRAHESQRLTVRVTAYLSVSDWTAHLEEVKNYPIRDDMYRVAGFKGYMDGSLGSRTAFMREPYSDAAADAQYPRGQLTAMAADRAAFQKMVNQVDAAKLQMAVHAIGDQANSVLLDAYAAAAVANGQRDSRHRVEHAQHLLVEDITRFSKLGVVASMQPFHKSDDGRYAEKALGPSRLAGSYAFRQIVDSGAMLAFGSDYPVVTCNPFEGIAAAVHGKTLSGQTWLPAHSLSLEEAMRAYTVAPPHAVHAEGRLGSIESGKYADFVILLGDPFSAAPEKLPVVRAWRTFLAGVEVYREDASGQ